MRDDSRDDRAESYLNRRAALAGGAALLTAGGTLVFVGDPAHAAVSIDDLTVADETFTTESVDPVVDVTVGYSYDAGNAAVESLRFTLSIDGETVATDELVTDRTTLENETTLSGKVTNADAYAASDFAPDVASSVSQELTIGLTFEVLGTDGTVLVGDTASDTAVVTVSHPQESEYVATVGGSGTIRTPDT